MPAISRSVFNVCFLFRLCLLLLVILCDVLGMQAWSVGIKDPPCKSAISNVARWRELGVLCSSVNRSVSVSWWFVSLDCDFRKGFLVPTPWVELDGCRGLVLGIFLPQIR